MHLFNCDNKKQAKGGASTEFVPVCRRAPTPDLTSIHGVAIKPLVDVAARRRRRARSSRQPLDYIEVRVMVARALQSILAPARRNRLKRAGVPAHAQIVFPN
jgi:hypothetical protein